MKRSTLKRKKPMSRIGKRAREGRAAGAASPIEVVEADDEATARKFTSFDQTKRQQPMQRHTRMRPRSERMEARYVGTDGVEGRRALVTRLLMTRPRCEMGQRIVAAYMGVPVSEARQRQPTGHPTVAQLADRTVLHRCHGISVDIHEVKARSAGGDILDENGVMTCCRSCHDFVGQHPREATALGLRVSRWGDAATQMIAEQANFE